MTIDDGVTTVAISPDNRLVAAGSLDKSVRVWDTTSGFLVERLEGDVGHRDSVYSVAFAPSGRELVSGSLDKTIKMWELANAPRNVPGSGPRGGKCIRTFEGHKDFVLSVALTIDGNWVLSGSKDRGVQFWDPVTGSAQLMLQGHKNSGTYCLDFTPSTLANAPRLSVISVAPSPTGKLFATGSGDMRARIWRQVLIHFFSTAYLAAICLPFSLSFSFVSCVLCSILPLRARCLASWCATYAAEIRARSFSLHRTSFPFARLLIGSAMNLSKIPDEL